MENDENTLK